MSEKKGNTFFPKEIFETKIGLEMNKDILYSLYKSGVTSEASLPIEFFFMSDHEEKIKRLYEFLIAEFPDYIDLEIRPKNDKYELSGKTSPIKMDLSSINAWNQQMWDLGYQFDCMLDGMEFKGK